MDQLIWLRKNLFNNWYNGVLTIVCVIGLFSLGRGVLFWIFNQAKWQVVTVNIHLFLVGRFPRSLYWRIWLALAINSIVGLITWHGLMQKYHLPKNQLLQKAYQLIRPLLAPIWLLTFIITIWLLGGGFGLQSVPTNLWNGLLLTLLMAFASIALSFPLGVLLALGRNSELPVIRWFSILYIELVRGLPLIGILFIAQVMLPLFLPADWRLDRLVRGVAGLVLFSAAYMAENVRGGLQSIPKGQFEAARALGLNTFLLLILVVLPQALRAVIPTIVGQFIGLFKDTSLLSLVGLVELTGIARSILAQPQFLGRYMEVYIFIGAVYWLFCYSMSLAARRLEI
ncbi:ABC transporter permease subunit [Cylindrospermopsis raciborskii CHAB3438]|uniref:amino acid ABC transporter permease n=1 Tax=Cylindrospermopsis raciborskii TaxID=77022 RepID=UPI001F2F55CD|nr:amino acid ABC transporter permease [Cylindrospermopsis raciborskii]MCH4904193.1 ABC transporter permease subunit [Cylindrospermopsis raciborskii CHAB3438]MEB3145556.1 amino acid ABC transporter permease [Cylindrospermopsis raciborskii]UJS05102.1 amino acid ABC transporter permease [Cylindrospermopsis raciborskii KLL07]